MVAGMRRRSSSILARCRWKVVVGRSAMRALSMVPDSAKATHLGGIPRRIILTTVGAFAKLYATVLNSTQVYNKDMLMSLVMSRPPGTPLVTVSNHMSTLDDPLMWGFQGFPISDPKLCRWTLAASDICFTNPFYSYFFRLGKCIPITRGEGIYQPHMSEALNRINEGDWIHTFPEGKVCQEPSPLRRLKWGTASLIAQAAVSPIVLPIAHSGFEKVLPENYWRGRRPLVPLWMKHISIVVGEPIQFDVPGLKQAAHDWARASAGLDDTNGKLFFSMSDKLVGHGSTMNNPHHLPFGIRNSSHCQQAAKTFDGMRSGHQEVSEPVLEEAAWRWMYTHITERIWVALQDLVWKAKTLNESRCKEQIQ